MKPIVVLITLWTFFHVIYSDFENIKWFLSCTQKWMRKWQKSVFAKKNYNFGINEEISINIWNNNYKASSNVM